MSERIDGRFEGEWLTITQAEKTLGLSPGAISQRLKKWGVLNKWTRKKGKYRLIHLNKLEEYEQLSSKAGVPIVKKKPYGWLTTWQAIDQIGDNCCHSVVWRALLNGRIRGVRRGNTYYYHPDDIEALRLDFNNKPLPGWVEIKTYTEALGADRTAASDWLRKHYEVRKYRREDKQVANYAEVKALEAWKAYYQKRLKFGRHLSEAKLKEIARLRAKGLSQEKTANLLGICQTTISQLELGKIYADEWSVKS